jgi:beta-lactam-binding protein with PASTA domain
MKSKLLPLFALLIPAVVLMGSFVVVQAQPAEESTTTEVPDVTDMNQDDARSEIMEAGLAVGNVTNGISDTVDPGNVMFQNPAAEKLVKPGTFVNLVISTGPGIKVPNVVGMSQENAQTAITSAQLVVGIVSPMSSKTASAGTVIAQDPKAKTTVAQGSIVNLILSSGP